MTDTREKLFETKYFLERMKENSSDRDAFKYNLSAFLAAVRSVTFIMQKEFKKINGFEEWYTNKQHNLQKDKTAKLLNTKRTITIHQELVRPRAHVNIGITTLVTASVSVSAVINHTDGIVERIKSEPTPPPVLPKNEVTTEWLWYFNELPEKDIVTLCEEHIGKFEILVAECESLFTS